MTSRFSLSSLSSVRCPSSRPVRASHSGPLSRSRIEVSSKNVCTFSVCLWRTSSARKSKTSRWLPEKDRIKPETSSRSLIESAANWRAAIQPSVTCSRAATSSAERFSPITSPRNAAASSGVKRKSAACSSVIWPLARSLARGRGGSTRAQRGQDSLAEALPRRPPERSDEIGEEPDGIVVSLVEREPGYGPSLAALEPLEEQRGLAEAGRGGDQGQPASRLPLEPLGEARTRDQLRAGLGWPQLGRHE